MAILTIDRPSGNTRRQTSPRGDIYCELGSQVSVDHGYPSHSGALNAAQRKIGRLN